MKPEEGTGTDVATLFCALCGRIVAVCDFVCLVVKTGDVESSVEVTDRGWYYVVFF